MSATTFAREFFRNWKTVGAVMPSSRTLAHRMIEAANVPRARRVLELGPGTGAITEVIHDCLPHGAHFLGLDPNPVFVDKLRGRFPGYDFVEAAAQEFDFDSHLPKGEGFDAIVSGLPWTSFPEPLQISILSHVLPRLAPGGSFVTFAYWGFHWLPGGRHFRDLLSRQLGNLRVTPIVWRNTPPAFVYVVQRDSAR
jgi:phospholipid N-methyltransferase